MRGSHYIDKTALYQEMARKGIKNLSALERMAGCGYSVVHQALRDHTRVTVKTLNSICFVLGVEPEKLIEKEAPVEEEKPEQPEGNVMLQNQLILRELKLQTELLEKLYSLLA